MLLRTLLTLWAGTSARGAQGEGQRHALAACRAGEQDAPDLGGHDLFGDDGERTRVEAAARRRARGWRASRRGRGGRRGDGAARGQGGQLWHLCRSSTVDWTHGEWG